jgi:hypothetical protein
MTGTFPEYYKFVRIRRIRPAGTGVCNKELKMDRRILDGSACIRIKANNMIKPYLRKLPLALVACLWAAQIAHSQESPEALPVPGGVFVNSTIAPNAPTPPAQVFDLDFAGGSPRSLVAAIEKATGKPLNAIVPDEYDNLSIPPMKFKDVTVPALFEALRLSSIKTLMSANGSYYQGDYGFQTRGHGDNAIWYFQVTQPPPPQQFCRFYQLGPYLQDYTIQDITTAIQTGWKLLGVKSPAQLKFHPETKLLIAVGPPEQLGTIDSVLSELRKAPKDAPAKKDGDGSKP